jgi:cytochrome c oxidase cbb3-type subunit 1
MIVGAHVHVGLLGWVSLALIGIFYYMVPLLSGKKLSWPGYVNWVFWISTIVITINHILLILGGISGGKAFKAGMQGPELGELLKPYMIPIGMLSIICGIVYILFAIQIIHTAAKKAS